MTKAVRTTLAGVVVLIGVGLMVGGIIAHKSGALVVGLIAAAVAIQQWRAARKLPSQGEGRS